MLQNPESCSCGVRTNVLSSGSSSGTKSAELVDDGVLLDGLADLVPHHALGLQEVDLRVGDQDGRAVGVHFEFAHSYLQ
ncbi:hypothetical protein [Halorubrum sp. Hd13]|uniref:hypothetical protein n=1 Tax=Halorubrum sp. Hd13 TaxID=1480728 RepID=UPI0020162B87|nr:hypothetical protein [Halorubrum sp. Hd13]